MHSGTSGVIGTAGSDGRRSHRRRKGFACSRTASGRVIVVNDALEQAHQIGIELGPGHRLQNGVSFLGLLRRLVGPFLDEGGKDIADRQDAGRVIDSGGRGAIRIAGAVEVFMMVARQTGDLAGRSLC